MKKPINSSLYYAGYIACLFLSVLVTYISVQKLFIHQFSGEAPDVFKHIMAFAVAIAFVALGIWCKVKSTKGGL